MHFQNPFSEADVARASGVPVTPRMFANATFEGVRAALVFRESYMKPVMQGILDPTPRERAIIDLHYRTLPFMASLCRLANPVYFQTLASSARSLFEVGLDLALLDRDATQESADRLAGFTRVERYRVATKLVDFYANRPVPQDLELGPQRALCSDAAQRAEVDQLREQHWGRNSHGDLIWPKHWSPFSDARGRAQQVGGSWEERYVRYYYQLSWHVHAGMVGAADLPQETFDIFSAEAYRLSTDVALDTYSILGATLRLAQAMQEWNERLTFLGRVIGLALVDERLQGLGEPARFLYREANELPGL